MPSPPSSSSPPSVLERLSALPQLRVGAAAPAADFERLAMIRFPLILLIVFFHNDRGGEFSAHLHDAPPWAGIVQLVAYGFGGIRVPTFFLIAGYIFFRSGEATFAWFAAKVRSRTRSVLLPLVLWNALALVSLALLQQLPIAGTLIHLKSEWATPVADLGFGQLAAALLGSREAQPLVYPLWFLHDLFVLVLLSPLIHAAIRLSRGWITPVLLIGWALDLGPFLVARDALLFFAVGSHLALMRRSIFLFDTLGLAAACGWLVLQAADMSSPIGVPAGKLKAVAGVVAVLYLSGWLVQWPRFARVAGKSARYSFFIFVAHEPLLTVVRRAMLAFAAPTTPLQWFVAYFAIVSIVIAILAVVFKAAERQWPVPLNVMTGGRATVDR